MTRSSADGRVNRNVNGLRSSSENRLTARLYPWPVRETSGARLVNAKEVVRIRLAFWSVLARNQGRQLRIDLADGPSFVMLSQSDLEAAVDALVGNVFAHTPDGTPFRVAVQPDPSGESVTLVVADAGAGLRDSGVLARGVSGAGSTGLGLDIARRIVVERHGGLVDIDSPAQEGKGTLMRVTLPLKPRS